MEHTHSTTYDYIIAGAGCAGLSLLYRILMERSISTKKILVVDRERKTTNDRTWCFWEKAEDLFQPIVCHEWSKLNFNADTYCDTFDIYPYKYKMIRAKQFYEYVYALAQKHENVEFVYENIVDIYSNNNNMAELETTKNYYQAQYIFNSTKLIAPTFEFGKNALLMHFKGWFIKTENNAFDPQTARLMDFAVDQQNATAFMYVMPLSSHEALVEYTLIGQSALKADSYKQALHQYITQQLGISAYSISHEEKGCIPMNKKTYPSSSQPNIINIGTAGNCLKASSGYAFQFIQAQTQNLVQQLALNQVPKAKKGFGHARFRIYDKTFIRVMQGNKMSGQQLMGEIFKHNSPANVMAFLANESEFADEYLIMKSLPAAIFLPAAVRELF